MDPVLNPLLNRELQRTGGRTLIRLGSEDIDYSPDFLLLLVTRNPGARFAPDLCSRVTIVNFTVTPASLQSQVCLRNCCSVFRRCDSNLRLRLGYRPAWTPSMTSSMPDKSSPLQALAATLKKGNQIRLLLRLCADRRPTVTHYLGFGRRAGVASCQGWATRSPHAVRAKCFFRSPPCVLFLPQALGSLLRAERPDVEERRTQMLQLQGEQSVKVI